MARNLVPGAAELYDRSVATLVGSWAYLASGSPGAAVIESDAAAIATFVHPPDREFLNNALLARGIIDCGLALDAVERAYAERGIDRYAVWVHGSEGGAAAALRARGYAYDSSTTTMAMSVAELAVVEAPALDLVHLSPAEFWRAGGLDGFAPGLAAEGSHFYAARSDGELATMLMAFDHDGDCGIYMVGTVPAARGRGLATALSAHAVREARERGCATVSLQSTPMAAGVYARVGLRDLGRFDEFTLS